MEPERLNFMSPELHEISDKYFTPFISGDFIRFISDGICAARCESSRLCTRNASNREIMFDIIKRYGTSNEIIKANQVFYTNRKTGIITSNLETEMFDSCAGVSYKSS